MRHAGQGWHVSGLAIWPQARPMAGHRLMVPDLAGGGSCANLPRQRPGWCWAGDTDPCGEVKNERVQESDSRCRLRKQPCSRDGDAGLCPDDAACGDAFGPQDPRSDLDNGLHRAQPRLHDLRHAPRAGREGRDQAADGREVRRVGRRQELHVYAARRPALARRQTGDIRGLYRLDQALGGQGRHGAEDDELRRYDRPGRREDLHHQAQGTDRPRIARPVQALVERAVHDAQARRRHRPQQADRRLHRIGPLRLRQG
ncbi:hypothetical protein ES703_123564 [subsurface metagenome]